MKRLIHSLSLCVLLAACGGGGGGGNNGDDNGGGGVCTPESGRLQITSNNAGQVAAEALEATFIPFVADLDDSLLYLFAVELPQQSAGALSSDLLKYIGERSGLTNRSNRHRSRNIISNLKSNEIALPYATSSEQFNCPDGGAYTLEINDADNNNLFSNGDVISLTFQDCQLVDTDTNSRITLNGQLAAVLELVTNNSLAETPLIERFTHTQFTVQTVDAQETTTVSLDGDIKATFECLSASVCTTKAEGNNLVVDGESSVTGSANFRVTNYVTIMTADDGTQESTYSGNGNLYIDSSGNVVSFATKASTPFKERYDDDYPYAGEEVSTGTCSSVKLTVLNNQNVKLSVDTDGDGDYEAVNDMTWSDFEKEEQ